MKELFYRLRICGRFGVLGMMWVVVSCAHVSSVPDKFSNTVKANVGIFADQTASMLEASGLGFSKDEAIYTREFFDKTAVEEQRFNRLSREVDRAFEDIIKYSLSLMILVEIHHSDPDLVAAYAGTISGVSDDLLEKLDLAPDYYAEVIDAVRSQKTFLGALRAAQPMVNAYGRYLNAVLDDLQAASDILAAKMDQKIDDRYARVIQYQKALEEEKYNVLDSMALLYKTYRGDSESFSQLKSSGNIRDKKLVPAGAPQNRDFKAIGEHLMTRLEALHRIGQEIEPDWELYRAAHMELDRVYKDVLGNIARARLTTLIWLRAHQKMAQGVENPAEWFDIKSLPRTLIQAGAGAAL